MVECQVVIVGGDGNTCSPLANHSCRYRQELSWMLSAVGGGFIRINILVSDWNSVPQDCNQRQWKHDELSVLKPGRHQFGQMIKVSITSGGMG